MLVSPCTLCPPGFRPSLAGCAAGVEFLLLHLPPAGERGPSFKTEALSEYMWFERKDLLRRSASY